tara:strand:- start:1407 stop:1784 length:378 start_codon:yes stop_codon:yes gene_type:complete
MGIDLLDNFGDWIQFIGCFFGLFFIIPLFSNIFYRNYSILTNATIFLMIINIIIPSILLYYYIFDYDIIFGLFLGSIHAIWIDIKNVDHYTLNGNTHWRRKYIIAIIIYVTIIIVMLYKIIRYIL